MTQPEALRLADAFIEDAADHLEVSHAWDMRPKDTINYRHYMNAIGAVVELRRLHAESQALTDALFQAQEAAKSLLAQRDALLEALKEIAADYADRFDLDCPSTNPGIKSTIKQARAAIKAAEENT